MQALIIFKSWWFLMWMSLLIFLFFFLLTQCEGVDPGLFCVCFFVF